MESRSFRRAITLRSSPSSVAKCPPSGAPRRRKERGAHSGLVTDKNGKRLGIYRKTHIPTILPSNLPGGTGSYEKFYFSPGNEFPVFDLCGAKIGIQICYDRKYPEGSRLLALKGEEILFMPICAATYGETNFADMSVVPKQTARGTE
jgi:predicted amidohydrolase